MAMAVWIGGIAYQSHVLLPAARRAGEPAVFAAAARRGRRVGWSAAGVVVLTGLYNVTRLGPLERVMASGAGVALAGKFILVLAMISLAAQRDFGQVPRLATLEARRALNAIAWLDRVVLLLAAAVIYLGLAVSRLGR
jgi:putative copper export protein